MTMWRVTVSPKEDSGAWDTFYGQGVIGIGWCDRKYDQDPPVRRFCQICRNDWIIAHVPAEYGGGDCMALAVGRVVSGYEEIPRSDLPDYDQWSGDFRRQYKVAWTLGVQSLRDILTYYRGTVHRLSSEQEKTILDLYGLGDTP